MSLRARIEAGIGAATGEPARFEQSRPAPGGIHSSSVVTLADGREVFVKTGSGGAAPAGMFAAEFEALTLIAAPGAIRIPHPIAFDEDYIVLEAFRTSPPQADWQETVGHQLAQLHQATRQDWFGFHRDNYLGLTEQPNPRSDAWLSFWRDHRLGWQLSLFADKAGPHNRLLALGDKLMAGLDGLLGTVDESAVLLHGDLWSGNAAADETGEPIIFDPASYYGHREAEIGMMRLFGGFGARCEAAYSEVWPLAPGAEQRIALYRLYHELNHLNLFGQGYYQACIATMESLL